MQRIPIHSGAGLIGLALALVLTGCGTVERRPFAELTAGEGGIPPDLARLIGYAALAPSSHNTQPWKVSITGERELVIEADRERWLSEVDPESRELMLSLGAFWENLEEAAPALGFETKASILAKRADETEILKVVLAPRPPSGDEALRWIEERTVIRAPYDDAPLAPEHLREIEGLLGTDFLRYYPRESPEGSWIADGLVSANRQQSYNDARQIELGHWLRFSRSEARERGDGLTAEGLGLSGLARFVWYAFMNQDDARANSFRERGIDKAREQVDGCSGFFLVCSDDGSVASLLEAGRRFERLALACARLEIALHPMSQLLEESPWKEEIVAKLKVSRPVAFVVRAGYTGERPPPSLRRPIGEFTGMAGGRPVQRD